jgi:transaldolase
VTGLTSNPTIFDKAIKDGTAYDADITARLEVSALLAHNTQTTIEQAQGLHRKAALDNLFIKIPGTPEGLPRDRGVHLRRGAGERDLAVLGRAVPGRGRLARKTEG